MDPKTIKPTPKQAEEVHLLEILSGIGKPEFETVDIADMVLTDINPIEDVSAKWVAFFAHYWSDALGNPFLVVEMPGRPKRYPVLDGRHRKLALHERGHKRYRVGALVYKGLSQQQMAAIFAYWNLMRRAVSPVEKFSAAVMHGAPVEIVVDRVLHQMGLRGTVRCYAALKDIVQRAETLEQGEQTVRSTLELLNAAFPDDPRRFNARLVKGTGWFFNRYAGHENFDVHDLPERVRRGRFTTAKLLLDFAEVSGGNQGAAYAVRRYLVDRHDAGRKTKRLEKPE